MAIKYEFAYDLQDLAEDISRRMFPHVKIDRIKCFRSYGSSTRGTIARCHALGKLMQLGMDIDAFYCLEFISERFEKMDWIERIKVIIHELMHIPESFGGGFKHHNVVTERNVTRCYKMYVKLKENGEKTDWFKLEKQKSKFRR